MLTNSSLTRRVLGGVVGVNLTLALAVSAGAVPRPGDNVHTAAATQVEELASPAPRQAGDVAAQVAPAPPAPAPEPTSTTAAPATTVAKPKVTTPPTTRAPKVAAAPSAAAPAPAIAAPAAPVAAVVATVARRVPTAAEIQGVITRLKADIPILKYVTISPTQINDAGNQICTAFDGGQTFTQVKATGLSMIPTSIKVPAATADYAVRQAVAMYCPGHANKLA